MNANYWHPNITWCIENLVCFGLFQITFFSLNHFIRFVALESGKSLKIFLTKTVSISFKQKQWRKNKFKTKEWNIASVTIDIRYLVMFSFFVSPFGFQKGNINNNSGRCFFVYLFFGTAGGECLARKSTFDRKQEGTRVVVKFRRKTLIFLLGKFLPFFAINIA